MALILIVDDSPTDAYLVKNMLQSQGYKTAEASSGTEAIEKSKSLKPDLILMDVVMPGLNGFQATRKITKDPATSHIPVVIVSSKNMDSDRAWGLMQGAKDFLVKPVKEQELLDTIKKLIS
jgi:twitching motility two-component system response regulator PilH